MMLAVGHSSSPGSCPKTSDSGQRNLLKPALENQSLTASRRVGLLGKWFAVVIRAPNRAWVETAI
jgi:hypothetical protein